MIRVLSSALALALAAQLCATALQAQEQVNFAGETYKVAYTKVDDNRHAVIEFIRQGETLKAWKKLVGIHRFAQSEQTPRQAAIALAAEVRKRDPAARFDIIENPKTKEALVDFLTSDQKSSVVEFNAFKYARPASGKGLIAFQYAQRFVLGTADATEVRAVRRKAVDAAAKFDLAPATTWFKQ